MSIKEIFCQDRAISVLQKAVWSGRLAHAYIFCGAEGVGKFKTAREFGKQLLCKEPVVQKGGFSDSCGRCESCRLFEGGAHPDFSHIYKELIKLTRDGKHKTTPIELPIDVIREFLVEKVSSKPVLSDKRVFIVSEAEKLNPASQNALLKTLEEPPPYCCIILLCTKPETLLATTRSRCQTVTFGPIDEENIEAKLKAQGVAGDAGRYFARLAQGSIGQALQFAALESEGAELYQTKRQIVEDISGYRYGDSLDIAERILGAIKEIAGAWGKIDAETSKSDINRRASKLLISIIIAALADAMRLGVGSSDKRINFDQIEQVKGLAQRLNAEKCAVKIADCYRLMQWVDDNVNEKLIFEELLLNLAVSDIIRV
jgi:DNA polymerase-3 subunit delta'